MTEPKKKPTRKKPATPRKPAAKKPTTPKKTTSAKSTSTTNKSSTTKKTTRARKPTRANLLKIPKAELTKFPYEMFPVKLFHMEGKDFADLKICSFTHECYALKYIERLGLKKSEYKMVKKK